MNNSSQIKKSVSIIIPMFNNYEYVNLCLDSIIKSKTDIEYKITVLDDKSNENESEKVKKLCHFIRSTLPIDISFIRNEENLGFAGNVNKGIKLSWNDSQISHLCILNSDTIVTNFWLDDLVSYSKGSLVSPVSNNVGNEQIIRAPYENLGPCGQTRQLAFEFASSWRANHLGNVEKSKMLGFFCILGESDLFRKVGLLDESFGRGYYEDDDYCHRILELGFELKIVRQCYVHHFGSISFNSIKDISIQELFKKNLEVFKTKHKAFPVDQTNSWIKAVIYELQWQNKQNNMGNMEQVIKDWFVPKQTHSQQIEISDALIETLNQYIICKYGKFPILSAILRRFFEILIGNPARKKETFNKVLKHITKRLHLPPFNFKNKIKFEKSVFIFFSTQSYFGRFQRPQHIANQLAQNKNTVIWIEPEFRSRKSSLYDTQKMSENFYIMNIPEIDYSNFYTSGITKTESLKILDYIQKIIPPLLSQKKNVKFIIQSPFWAELTNNGEFEVIYDCMDLQEGFSTSTLEITFLEQKLIENSDKIIVSSNYLKDFICEHLSKLNKSVSIEIIKNACDPEHFQIKKATTFKKKEQTIGYFGAIADWFDAELVFETAKLLPNLRFELIGEVTNHFIKENKLPNNIVLLGEKPYSELPFLTQHWNCALIPFKINDLILATNPVKLYEYCALGLPVVSTPIPEVISTKISSLIADNPSDFANHILSCLRNDSDSQRQMRFDFSAQNSWKKRGLDLLNFIEGLE